MPDSAADLPLTVPFSPLPPDTPQRDSTPPPAPDTVNDPFRTGDWQPMAEIPTPSGLPTIPGFVLEKELGRGGMGVVYRARQMPLNRPVALKMILAGDHASADAKSRFLAEAEAIAKLRHPGIVQVHEFGTHQGNPYFALEFIDGGSLDKALLQGPLLPPDAARLVAQLAEAMHAAHTAGIIHRDLKPANVLLASVGASARRADSAETDARRADALTLAPKITDFGLAKQIDTGPGLTASGAIMGTPSYMAPEQAAGKIDDIGPATDVYALGAILYECLTGRPPFRAATVFDTLDMVLRQEPVPVRQLQPKAPKDLETICHKCLQKEQGKRYASALDLADDLRNYLDGKPITARPVGRMERTWKWCKRYPAVATLLFTTTLAAIIASGAAAWAVVAERAATTAATKEKAANELTAQRLEQIEKINNSVFDVFTEFDIRKVKAGPNPVEYVLAQRLIEMGKKLDARAIHDPLVLANLQNRLGHTLLSLGKAQEAIDFLTASRDIRQTNLVAGHADTLTSMNNLAMAYDMAGKFDLALPLYEETLKLTKAQLGPDHLSTLTSMNNVAIVYMAVGKLDLALPLLEESLKRTKAQHGPDHFHTLCTMANLAEGYQTIGKLDLALPLYEEAFTRRKATLGPDHPDTLSNMDRLAGGYHEAGKLNLALPLYEETFTRRKATLGPDHPNTLISMRHLAVGYQAAGKLDLALPRLEETLKLQKAKLGPDHPETLVSMNALAMGYMAVGKLNLALPYLEETLIRRKAKLGPDHPETLTSMANLAAGYRADGKPDLALPLLEETLKLQKAKLGTDHPKTLESMNELAVGYTQADKLDLALPLLEETLKLVKAKLGPDHPDTLGSMNNLATGYQAVGKLDLALPLLEETLRLSKVKQGTDHPKTLLFMQNLAANYWSAKQLDKSVPLFEEALRRQEGKLGRQHPNTQSTVANLGVNYKDAGRLTEALPLLEEAYAFSKRHPPLRFVGQQLLDGYTKAGKTAQAVALRQELLMQARQTLPKESPQLAGELAKAGLTLVQLKAFPEAEPLLRECLMIRQKKAPDVWTTFNTQSLLGAALLGQKKYAEAEPLLLLGYEGMKQREAKIPKEGKVRLTEALERLVQLYEATGKKDEAAKWRKELDQMRSSSPPGPPKP